MTGSAMPAALDSDQPADARVCTIVICDDQPEVREAIGEVLTRNPRFAVVGHAGDGDSCLERVRQAQPDLLILDVNMPGGGPHVAAAAKVSSPSSTWLPGVAASRR